MNEEEQYAAWLVAARNSVQLNPDVVSETDEQQQGWIKSGLVATTMLLGLDITTEKFDEGTVQKMQDYLLAKHQHRVLKWNKDGQAVRILTAEGVPTSSKKQLERYKLLLNGIGIAYAYCVANCTAGKIVFDDGSLMVRPAVPGIPNCFPVAKVFKYLRYGDEDSLVAFLNIVKKMPETEAAFDEHLKLMQDMFKRATGAGFPAGYRVRRMHDQHGNFSGTVILDKDARVLMESGLL